MVTESKNKIARETAATFIRVFGPRGAVESAVRCRDAVTDDGSREVWNQIVAICDAAWTETVLREASFS